MIKEFTQKKGYNGFPFPTKRYYPVCDICGLGHNGTSGFSSRDLSLESAKSHGWLIDAEIHLCRSCRGRV